MLLYEFTEPNSLLIQLVATIGQLTSSIDSGQEKPDWTVDELLRYLKDSNIILDRSDLLDMVSNPPLNHSIANIQGDNVIFKGQESEEAGEQDEDENKKIVKQMAAHATK